MKSFFKIISLFLCLSLFLIPIRAEAHSHTAYSHDSNVNLNMRDWMSKLSDKITINELSIPGTGNSMSYGNYTDFSLTQSMDLETQLESGIRFLDLSLNYSGDLNFKVVNGIIDLNVTLIDVLKKVAGFLNHNREEVVLIKISKNNSESRDFGYSLRKAIEEARLDNYIFDGSRNYNPTLGEARGKIILLADYSGNMWKAIPYKQNSEIQDHNHLVTNWDLYSKWEHVKEFLNKINKRNNKSTRYINYLTGSGGSFPYFVASGHVSSGTNDARLSTGLTEPGFSNYYPDFPRVNRFGVFATIAFEGINTLTYSYFLENDLKFTGIVVIDFPGAGIIKEIINLNFKNSGSSGSNGNTSLGSGNGSSSTNKDGWGFTYKKL